MNCPSPRCGSSNVQLLSHYRESLPPGSELRSVYAAPATAEGGSWPPLLLAAVGVLMLVSGGAWAGLAALVVAGLWGFVLYKRVEAAERARAVWANRRICLACTEQWTP